MLQASKGAERAGEKGFPDAMSVTANRPRLLVLTPDFPPTPGGIQLLTYRVAAGLDGFQTSVFTFAVPGDADFDRDSGLATSRLGLARLPAPVRIGALNAIAVVRALRTRPDVVLSAHIVTAPAAAAIARALRIPWVQYFHANEIGGKPRLAKFAVRAADAVIAVSSYTASLIAATGARPRVLRLIPPGVELPAERVHERPAHPTILTVARLRDRYKGHDVLIAALAIVRKRVPDAELVVIGDGPLRGELEALARAAGVGEAVRFLGTLPDEQRDRWLRRCDVFAMPSQLPEDGRAGEGFGIVYLEAAAYGKPVVAGNVAGALDAVADGETGLLVDPTAPAAVAEAIARLLLDRELARRMGDAGAERAAGFAWPLIAARVQELLVELVDHR
jgi:phosphatidylinositol alpha-1,6-mannosyltransferase